MPKNLLDTGALAFVTFIRLAVARTSISAFIETVSVTWIRWSQVELQSARARAANVTPGHSFRRALQLKYILEGCVLLVYILGEELAFAKSFQKYGTFSWIPGHRFAEIGHLATYNMVFEIACLKVIEWTWTREEKEKKKVPKSNRSNRVFFFHLCSVHRIEGSNIQCSPQRCCVEEWCVRESEKAHQQRSQIKTQHMEKVGWVRSQRRGTWHNKH